jgi:hypothetical protein
VGYTWAPESWWGAVDFAYEVTFKPFKTVFSERPRVFKTGQDYFNFFVYFFFQFGFIFSKIQSMPNA